MGTIEIDGSTPKLTIGNATAEDATILFDGNAQDFHIGLDDSSDDLVIGVGSALGTTTALAIDENAGSTFSGTVTVGVDDTGKDVKFFGASAGAYMEWDESADQLRIMGASADATTSTGKLLLATSLTDINANDVIGKIEFQAPHEAGGTDAITVAASIQAVAQSTFSSSSNATDLIFYTGHSEAAAEKIRITSQNEIGIAGANYGTDGQVLTSGGAGAAVAWEDASGAVTALNNATQSELVTVGSTTTELDAEANLTFTGSALTCIGTITTGVDGTGHDVKFFGATASSHMLWDESADALNLVASTLGVGAVGTKDLGTGIHIKTSDSGLSSIDTTGSDELVIESSGNTGMMLLSGTSSAGSICFGDSGDDNIGLITYDHSGNNMQFHTNATERVRVGSGGQFAISNSNTFASTYTLDMQFTGTGARMNRADDGAMLLFQSAGSTEGNVSISGSTCTYTTFTGAHWSQLSDNSKPTILKGTVMETINEMCDWYVLEFLNQDGKTTKEQHLLQAGQSAGDVINHTYEDETVEATIVKEENNNLAKVKISDSEDSKAVYGVFQTWDEDNDMNVVGLGTFVIRVHSGETVAIGDLLSSKGDGTAKVQADDIMRARTIAKVTSTIKQTTYADDSYTVPCTLHCG